MRLLKKAISRLILKHRNDYSLAAASLLCPEEFVSEFFRRQENDHLDWKGKKAGMTVSFDLDSSLEVEALDSLLKILSKCSFKVSFACMGKLIEKYPEQHMSILEQGHEILNHTHTHPNCSEFNPHEKFDQLTPHRQREEIAGCHAICQKLLDYEPIGFRSPHFKRLHTDSVYHILKEMGYSYSSSTLAVHTPSHGTPFSAAQGVLEFPVSPCPVHLFTVFDTYHALRSKKAVYFPPGKRCSFRLCRCW
jgi:peptidoglycan/xylan/chitin deacetylase (PgdA/CDA1 family)